MVLLKTFALASDSQVRTELTEELGCAWLSSEVWLDKNAANMHNFSYL